MTEHSVNARRWIERQRVTDRWRRGLFGPAKMTGAPRPAEPSLTGRPLASRPLHRLGDFTAHAVAGLSAALAVFVWLAIGLNSGFPNWWQIVLYSVSSSITLIMVFAIQHTQSRQQSATQRKLDELPSCPARR